MSLNANNSKNVGNGGGSTVEPVEPGTYPARLVAVVDLGLQAQRPYQGQEKAPVYQILTTYELADEFVKDEDGVEQKDKPRWVSERFALYSLTSDKATSTKRYNAIDPQHVNGGDWASLVGSPVLVTVVHNPGKGKNEGKVFSNIASTSPMRAKDAERVAALVNDPLIFDLDNPSLEVFNELPEFIQTAVKANLEFAGSKLEKLLKAGGAPQEKKAANAKPKAKPVVDETDDEENPY